MVALYERPTIDVADVTLPVASEKIETANMLSEDLHDLLRNEFLLRRQEHRVALLLAHLISLNNTIQPRRLSSLGMHVVRPYRINLNIKTISSHEFLVDIVTVGANFVNGLLIQTATVFLLPKQLFPPASIPFRIVDADLVIFGVEGLLNERFLKFDAADKQAIILLRHGIVLVN